MLPRLSRQVATVSTEALISIYKIKKQPLYISRDGGGGNPWLKQPWSVFSLKTAFAPTQCNITGWPRVFLKGLSGRDTHF